MESRSRLSLQLGLAVLLAPGAFAPGAFAQEPVPVVGDATAIPRGERVRPPRAPRVWTVSFDPADMADFLTIQAAIGRARDGDIILVLTSPIAWGDVTLDGKSLTLLNESGVNDGVFLDDLVIRNITGHLVLRGIQADRIEISASPGTVWIEQSTFRHVYPQDCGALLIATCTGGDIVGSNTNVAVWDTYLQGDFGLPGGGDDVCNCSYFDCLVDPSCITCTEDPALPPGPGEPALWLMGTSSAFLSGSDVRGGAGGTSFCGLSQAEPGPAVRTTSSSSLAYLDTSFAGSVPRIEGNPTVVDYGRTAGSYTVSSALIAGAPATATLAGRADTQAFVVSNSRLDVAPAPQRFGVLVVRLGSADSMYFGTVPSDGSPISSSFPVGDLGPGEGAVLFTQSLFVEDLGAGTSETVLGAPSVLVQVD